MSNVRVPVGRECCAPKVGIIHSAPVLPYTLSVLALLSTHGCVARVNFARQKLTMECKYRQSLLWMLGCAVDKAPPRGKMFVHIVAGGCMYVFQIWSYTLAAM